MPLQSGDDSEGTATKGAWLREGARSLLGGGVCDPLRRFGPTVSSIGPRSGRERPGCGLAPGAFMNTEKAAREATWNPILAQRPASAVSL